MNTAIWVAAIGGTATVAAAFVPFFILIARSMLDRALAQNSAEHGETKMLLNGIHEQVAVVHEKVDANSTKLDTHIEWHAYHPQMGSQQFLYMTPVQVSKEDDAA